MFLPPRNDTACDGLDPRRGFARRAEEFGDVAERGTILAPGSGVSAAAPAVRTRAGVTLMLRKR